jgi:hypothetical protein
MEQYAGDDKRNAGYRFALFVDELAERVDTLVELDVADVGDNSWNHVHPPALPRPAAVTNDLQTGLIVLSRHHADGESTIRTRGHRCGAPEFLGCDVIALAAPAVGRDFAAGDGFAGGCVDAASADGRADLLELSLLELSQEVGPWSLVARQSPGWPPARTTRALT